MIGFGYDIHRLALGGPLKLGGVEIPSDRSAIAHSDGDVLLHAICDAILGAAALGDIGRHFPDTEGEFQNISSIELLRRVMRLVHAADFLVRNIDATIVLERPKIGAFADVMREHIAAATGAPVERISIKAKTNEGIGAIGSRDAIAAYAVAQLE